VPALTRLLADPSWEVRSKAAWALGQIGDRGATDALAGALKDARADVRKSAAWALGQIGNDRE
jgi:HEAT repeat protein